MEARLDRAITECTDVFEDRAVEVDREGVFPTENFDLLHEKGLLTLAASEENGGYDAGYGGDYDLLVDAIERITTACANTGQCFTVQCAALGAIKMLGTREQREFFTDEVRDRGAIFGYYGAEPGQQFEGDTRVDYDTVAVETDDGWRITGQKSFATNSTGADYHLLYALKEGATDMGGLIQAVVPDGTDGFVIHDTWDGMGQRATSSGLVELDDVEVPDEFVIGEPGALIDHPHIADNFQLSLLCVYSGITQGALEFALWYLDNESKPPADLPSLKHDPHVQLHVGDMDIGTRAVREFTRSAARKLERSHEEPQLREEASMDIKRAKVMSSELVVDVSSRIFQICGARATSEKYGADRFWRNGRTFTLHDIHDKQKTDVARYVLGLQRKDRFEKS